MRPLNTCSFFFLLVVTLCAGPELRAQKTQPEERWIRHQIATLAGTPMAGRGYYKNGRDKAAKYIVRKFREFGLRPMGPDSSYTQRYAFDVNTFPGDVNLSIGKKSMQPSGDYLVHAASTGRAATKQKIVTIDCGSRKVLNAVDSLPQLASFFNKKGAAYLLKNTDTLLKKINATARQLPRALPPGTYLIPQKGKLMWTVATDTMPATVFQIADTSLPRHPRRATYTVSQRLETNAPSDNVLGFVPGTEVPDSFILFTAHYDHLGQMGHEAQFPGASDNASGTAMMLYLANYFVQHPQRYSIGFIAFSGEEAGLIGSEYFTSYPTIPLSNIRFVTNLDIMGDATDGISIVNGTARPGEVAMLETLNSKGNCVPRLVSGGPSANSDHYHFIEAGVPAVFIFTRGGPGYYHDVWDKPNTLKLTNIAGLSKLLIGFAEVLCGKVL